MKRTLVALMAAILALGLGIQEAQARRLGGGGSFGMSRSSPAMRPAPAPAPAAPGVGASPSQPLGTPAAAPRPGNRWLGPLAGIATGIGLAALFSHFGLGEGFADLAMVLLLVGGGVILLRFLFARQGQEGRLQYAGGDPGRYTTAPLPTASGGATAPEGFDTAGFLRQAKLNFVRLQAANDAGDMADLKQFTTPEVFAEIQLQFEERGRARQQTDVVQLEAELLELLSEGGRHIASVRFFGQLRETPETPPAGFDEVWHLVKPEDGSVGWRIAGIQQIQ